MQAIGYASLANDIKELAHSWLLGRKRRGIGLDRPDAKRIQLDVSIGEGSGGGGGNGRGKSSKGDHGGAGGAGGAGKAARGGVKKSGKF